MNFIKSIFRKKLHKKYFFIPLLLFWGIYSADAIVYKNKKIVVENETVLKALHSAALHILKRITTIDNSQKEIIFQEEVKPYIYEIIPSHKVLKRSRKGDGSSLLSVQAEIDVTGLYSFFAFNSHNLKDSSLRAVVAIAGHEGGRPGSDKEYTKEEKKLKDRIAHSMKEHLDRRGFRFISYGSELSAQSYIGEDFELDSTFRKIANKSDSNIVIFLKPKFEFIIKKPRNIKIMHFHMKAKVYERSTDTVLMSLSKSTPMWMGKKSVTTRNKKVLEKMLNFINRFSHTTLRLAGVKYLAKLHKSSNLTLRVVAPPDFQSLEEFKKYLLSTLPSLESITEKELRKSQVDYKVNLGKTKEKSLISAVKSMDLENYSVFVGTITSDKILPIHLEKKEEEEPKIDSVALPDFDAKP